MINVSRILFVGATRLNYTEAELFRMTPRKYFRIYDEYLELNGLKKKEAEFAIDELP